MKKMTYIFTLSIALISALMFSCGGGGGGAGDSFTVGYNANGADSGSAPSAQSCNLGASLTVKANSGSLAKNGYLFDGWNTKADGSGTDYMPGASYKGDDITLYAKWARLFNYSVNNPGFPAQALNSVQRAPGNPTATITGLTPRGSQLSSVIIPGSMDGYTISGIGNNAFQDCDNITDVTIPDTVTNIGNNTFSGCSNLNNMILLGIVPPIMGTGVFNGCSVIINVPQSALSSYQGASGWATYSQSIVFIGANTYCVVYDSNGADMGLVPMMRASIVGGYPVTVEGNIAGLKKAGCSFNGWNTEPDGSGYGYKSGQTIQLPGGRITLYAQWYHLTYSSNNFEDRNNANIGDIVLASGRTCSVARYNSEYSKYTEADGVAVGIVAYKGITGSYGKSGSIYMIGLEQESLKWGSGIGYNTKFNTSMTAGEDNWAIITATDPTAFSSAAANYPAFNYANTYSVDGFGSSWFLPSVREGQCLRTNKNILNNSLSAIISLKISASELSTKSLDYYWSSSQDETRAVDAYLFSFFDGDGVLWSPSKADIRKVLVVRALDD